MRDVVIVGAGVAGCTAAVQLVRQGCKVALLDRQGRAGGLLDNAWRVENCPFLAQPTSGKALVRQLEQWLHSWSVKVEQATVVEVVRQGERWRTLTAQGDDWESRVVLLAVGTMPVPFVLPVRPDAALPPHVHTVVPLVREITALPPCSPGERIAILGGGDVALDYALSAACGHHLEVDLLIRGDGPRAIVRLVRQVEAIPQIHLYCRSQVIHACPADEGAILLVVQTPWGEQTLRYRAVVAAVGRESALTPLQLPPLGALDRLDGSTDQPGLFVIGDARRGRTGQATMAAADGLAAALALTPTHS